VLEPGNVIDAVNTKPTPTLDVLLEVMKGAQLNSVVTLTIHDLNSDANKSRRDVKVRLIPSPGDPSRAIIGFVPADTRTVEVPFEVDIDTDSIGGPSAGLAFTLSLLDELTPGALAGNVKVATTGTIDEDGNVGAIGALHQKAVAVKASGAKVFLVPATQTEEEIADAKAVAGKSFAVIPVKNLDEALKALQKYGGGLKQ
jgi:PDZ domain-containing protein